MSAPESDPAATPSRRLLAYLLVSIGVALVGYVSIALAARAANIPPPLDESIAVSERLQFVKDNRPSTPTAVVMGSSLAMFNLDTGRLAAEEGRPFLNLGAAGLKLADIPLLYRYYRQVMPLSEVLLLTNYFELRHSTLDLTTPEPVIVRYLQGGMSLVEESTYRDWKSLSSYLIEWKELHARSSLNSIAFDATGAVPVDAQAATYDPDNWNAQNMTWEAGCEECMAPVESLCRAVRAEDKRFTLVLTPVLPSAMNSFPHLRAMKEDRKSRARSLLARCGGELIDLGEAAFDASCFVDIEHLNAKGMARLAELVARHRAGGLADGPGEPVRCA